MTDKPHNIEFTLYPTTRLRVLQNISRIFKCPSIGIDDAGELFFNIRLCRECAQEFYNKYNWAMMEICDMDQDDGGSYL